MGGRSFERDFGNDDERDIAAIRHAISLGINHIDTGDVYAGGHAETLIGLAVEGMGRNEFTVSSKVIKENHSYESLIESCRSSLNRMNLEYVDVYYLHSPSDQIPFQETAKAMRKLRSDGLIKHYGICNFTASQMQHFQDYLDAPIAVNQSLYSLAFRRQEKAGLVQYCRENGAIFAAWRPLQWHYAGKSDQPIASAWQRGAYPLLDSIADRLGKTNVQIALNWLISQAGVVALAKSSSIVNINEMSGALGWVLSDADAQALSEEFPDQRF